MSLQGLSDGNQWFYFQDVQSRIRKGERGIVIFAGDVTPVGNLTLNLVKYINQISSLKIFRYFILLYE